MLKTEGVLIFTVKPLNRLMSECGAFVQLHINAVNEICIMKTQPAVYATAIGYYAA